MGTKEEEYTDMKGARPHLQPLFGSTVFNYNRLPQDKGWTMAFAAMGFGVIIGAMCVGWMARTDL